MMSCYRVYCDFGSDEPTDDRLSELLTVYRDASRSQGAGSRAFRKRCRNAAEIALSVAKLRKEQARIGFAPLPLAEYIEGLAKGAGVRLPPVLAWAGIPDLASDEGESLGRVAGLACVLGLSLRRALAHARFGLAEQLGLREVAAQARCYGLGRGRKDKLEECEAALDRLEADYDARALKKLRRIESEFRAEYADQSDAVG